MKVDNTDKSVDNLSMNITPHPKLRIVLSFFSDHTRRFGHIYESNGGEYRLRFGVEHSKEYVFAGLKMDDAQELLAEWMYGAALDEMEINAYYLTRL